MFMKPGTGISGSYDIGGKQSLSNRVRGKRLASSHLAASLLLRLCTSRFETVKAPFDALAHWKRYMDTDDERQYTLFLAYAHWLLQHEVHISDNAGGWPLTESYAVVSTTGPWLSALVQGISLSVLLRAYQVTYEESFLLAARRVVRTFEFDILDGGVCAPIGASGVCFEEVATYPAGHMLNGFICGLYGLHDYVAMTGDRVIERLVHCGHDTLHLLCEEYDTGYWTRADLLQYGLASLEQHILQIELLGCLASDIQCTICATYVEQWKRYYADPGSRLLRALNHRFSHYRWLFALHLRSLLFPATPCAGTLHVGIPVIAFPITGGMRSVLISIAQVMQECWQIEYVTQRVGPHSDAYVIHRFGTTWTHASQFPAVWLYCLAGAKKLISLLRHRGGYQLLLPQDGVFSAAFTVLVGKVAGIRVVAVDHGNLTLFENNIFQAERIQNLAKTGWSRPRQLLARLQFKLYWPSLKLLASISTRYVDHFLIPGVDGDDETEACARLGIGASRITRFNSMVDLAHYALPSADELVSRKLRYDIAPDAIVIALVCRLATEKGVDIALRALALAISTLVPDLRERVRVIIAGDGPLFQHMERQVVEWGLSRFIVFWGDTPANKVKMLLSLSDIFLYTSVRGACLSISVLEAMASACAVVATPLPQANVHMLADGRGIVVPAADAAQTSGALLQLINDSELRHHMGLAAREYVARYHSPEQFRRILLRVAGGNTSRWHSQERSR